MTGPINPANWTHKKRLPHYETTFSILASVFSAPLNQISGLGSIVSFAIRRLSTIWHHKQPLSGTKANFIVLIVSVTRIVHSFSHVKQLFGRVNAERRIIKRIGRSHQVQRDRCDDSSERNIGSQVELTNFSLFPWVNLCSN